MNTLGFFCIDRRIFSHDIFRDPERFRAWIDLIGNFTRGSDNCVLMRGQFQVAENELAKRWGWTRSAVHRFLDYLKTDGMIDQVKASTFPNIPAVYRVINYEKYNGSVKVKSSKKPAKQQSEHLTGQLTEHLTGQLKLQKDLVVSENSEHLTGQLTEHLTGHSYKEETKINNVSIPSVEKSGKSETTQPPQPDEAYEIFREVFASRHYGEPYRPKKADFVQFALLRKDLKIGTRETPMHWNRAVSNYFASSIAVFTLADICANYPTFVRTSLDRFKQPVQRSKNPDIVV